MIIFVIANKNVSKSTIETNKNPILIEYLSVMIPVIGNIIAENILNKHIENEVIVALWCEDTC